MPRQLNVIIFWAFERCLEHRVSLLSAGFPFLHPTPVCFCCNKFPLRRQISLRTRPSLKLPVDVDISDYALIILLINPSVLMFFSPHLEGGLPREFLDRLGFRFYICFPFGHDCCSSMTLFTPNALPHLAFRRF